MTAGWTPVNPAPGQAELLAWRAMYEARNAYDKFILGMTASIQEMQQKADELGSAYCLAQDRWRDLSMQSADPNEMFPATGTQPVPSVPSSPNPTTQDGGSPQDAAAPTCTHPSPVDGLCRSCGQYLEVSR